MARLSKVEKDRRYEAILDSCRKLYSEKSFQEINLKEISRLTDFSRTAIYSYFINKEEIFLALLQEEYKKWILDLEKITEYETLDIEEFSQKIADSIRERNLMFKILGIDMSSLDSQVRMENLIQFKAIYGKTLEVFSDLIRKYFKDMSEEEIVKFNFSFFPFLYGVHSYTVVTEKQEEAMNKANVPFKFMTKEEIIKNCVKQLLSK